jgi:hypothetical protein
MRAFWSAGTLGGVAAGFALDSAAHSRDLAVALLFLIDFQSDQANDFILFCVTFDSIAFGHVIFEFALGNRMDRRCVKHVLSNPQQQQRDRQIPHPGSPVDRKLRIVGTFWTGLPGIRR